MQEDFLWFLWQFLRFDLKELKTIDGKSVQVIHAGNKNSNSGPDFSESKIIIDGIIWAGNVEMHLKSSDWDLHKHQNDEAYSNVVLHVVWRHDKAVSRIDGTTLPTLELEGRADIDLLDRYKHMIKSQSEIPCQNVFPEVKEIYKIQTLDYVLTQRLQSKAALILELLEQNNNDWEETAYQVLMKNFGFKINSEAFLTLSNRIPYKILRKHSHNRLQLEALLFGQSGMLNEAIEDEYVKALKREYNFLSYKYSLHENQMKASEWKLLRLRPANFPSLRIAQLASFLHKNPIIFSALFDWESVENLRTIFQINTSVYWQTHYLFGHEAKDNIPDFGKTSLENILINTVVPLLVCYSNHKDDLNYLEKAVSLLEKLPPEENKITKFWKSMGLEIANAFDSQGSIELYNHFCVHKKCLSCKIGTHILVSEKR